MELYYYAIVFFFFLPQNLLNFVARCFLRLLIIPKVGKTHSNFPATNKSVIVNEIQISCYQFRKRTYVLYMVYIYIFLDNPVLHHRLLVIWCCLSINKHVIIIEKKNSVEVNCYNWKFQNNYFTSQSSMLHNATKKVTLPSSTLHKVTKIFERKIALKFLVSMAEL